MHQSALKSQLTTGIKWRTDRDLQVGAFTAISAFGRQTSAAALWRWRLVHRYQTPVCVLTSSVGCLTLWHFLPTTASLSGMRAQPAPLLLQTDSSVTFSNQQEAKSDLSTCDGNVKRQMNTKTLRYFRGLFDNLISPNVSLTEEWEGWFAEK